MNIHYNIHNLLNIRIEDASWHFVKDLNFRYRYFEDEGTGPLDILVTIGRFTPDLRGCYCLDRKFYVKKNYIYLKDSDKNLKWEAEIFNIENDSVRINFSHGFGNHLRFPWCLFPDLIMELYILQPLIEWRLSLKDCLLLHAGAVSRNDRAILLAGRGGSGKTQHVIDLLQKGFDLVSDDMVILRGTDVLSLPLSLGLFTFSYRRIKKEELNLVNQIRLFLFLLKKNEERVSIVDCAKLDKAYIIFLTQRERPRITDLDIGKAVDHLMWNQKMERTSYVSYKYVIGRFLDAYEYVFPEVNFNAAFDRVKGKLVRDMERNQIETKAIELPQGQKASPLICD